MARINKQGKLVADLLVADGELVDSKLLDNGDSALRLFVPDYILGDEFCNTRYLQVEFQRLGEEPQYLLRNARDRFPSFTDNLYEQINSGPIFENVQEVLTDHTASTIDAVDERYSEHEDEFACELAMSSE